MTDSAHSDDIANSESPASSLTEGDASDISASGQPSSNSFRWKRVVATAGTLFIIGGVTAGAIWYVMNLEPVLHPVRGVVYLDDEPMTDGAVMTTHAGGRLGALAVIDKNGRFELRTNGEAGAYQGEHKVTIMLTNGGFPPVSLIPKKYSNAAETPFTISVDANTQDTEIKLELFGRIDAPSPPAGGFTRPGVPTSSETEDSSANSDGEGKLENEPETSKKTEDDSEL